jgi:hypothetical protein
MFNLLMRDITISQLIANFQAFNLKPIFLVSNSSRLDDALNHSHVNCLLHVTNMQILFIKKLKTKNMQISLALDDEAHVNTLNDKPRKRKRNALNQTAGSFTHVFHEGFCSEKKMLSFAKDSLPLFFAPSLSTTNTDSLSLAL